MGGYQSIFVQCWKVIYFLLALVQLLDGAKCLYVHGISQNLNFL